MSQTMSDIKERLLEAAAYAPAPIDEICRVALARIEALEVERSCTCCDIPCPLESLARIEALEAHLAAAREALEKIASGDWGYTNPIYAKDKSRIRDDIPRGNNVAYMGEWAVIARAALASLPAPEAAPTREEIARSAYEADSDLQVWQTTNCPNYTWDELKALPNANDTARPFYKIADAILALKAAPAK